ncbi:hypothetical protein ACIA8G_09065 [Lentzea sp. NPDC051213]|uniref:DUF2017 family protein n=1 Tax=Lentzea sp. NPDC051213 TaxID=3364126 RepID=UPI0037A59051
MICWDRFGEEFIGVFDEYEVEVLRGYAEALLELLDHRAGSYTSMMLGEQVVQLPGAATTDNRLIAILRERLGTSEPSWMLAWSEARCLAEVREAVTHVLSTLPSRGGRVRLAGRADAVIWLQVTKLYIAALTAKTDHAGVTFGRDVEPTTAWLESIAVGLAEAVRTDSAGTVDNGR